MSNLTALCLFVLLSLLVVAIIFIVQIIMRYRYQRIFFRKILGLQENTVVVLSESLTCVHVFASKEFEKISSIALDKDFISLFGEEFKTSLMAAFERIKAGGYSSEIVIRLHPTLGGDWYKVYFSRFGQKKGGEFLGILSPVNDLMNFQNSEREIRRKEQALQKIYFNIVFCVDVESRKITLYNDVVEARHGAVSRPAGTYDLREIITLQDYEHFEERLNERIRNFLKFGVDLEYERILNLRMLAPQHGSVWHAVRGVIVRGDDGRLLMYGTTHRLEKLQFSEAEATDFSNMFGLVLGSSVLRMFWCDLEGNILGGNTTFARDLHLSSLKNLTSVNIYENFEGIERDGMRLLASSLTKLKNEKNYGPISRKFSFPGKTPEEGEARGVFELLPMVNDSGVVCGGCFVYWFDS